MPAPNVDSSRKLARRDRVLTIRSANPFLTQPEIAKLANVSARTVARVLKEAAPAMLEAQSNLSTYQDELRKLLNIPTRAKTLVGIAQNAKHPREQLKALVRIDDLDGIVTEKDRLRAHEGTTERHAQALFQLPAGATISIGFSSAQPVEEAKVIDVTPDDSGT